MARYIANRLNLDDLASSRPVLQLFDREGPRSQSDAARALGLSAGACNLHFQRLEHEGLIEQVDLIREKRGRPRQLWDLAGGINHVAVLVFDVPYFQASLIDFHGTVLLHRRDDVSTCRSADLLLRKIDDVLDEARRLAGRGRIRQVLVATPGLLEASGAVASAVNFPILDGLDLAGHVRERFGLPAVSAPLGLPYYYGETEHLPAHTPAMVVHWDLGVGVVFGCGTDVYSFDLPGQSPQRRIWEIGHMRIEREGHPCHCGRRGCLEAHTGGWVLMEALANRKVERLSDLVRLVEAKDPLALRIVREAAGLLGRHLSWPMQLTGTKRVIVTGPMAPAFERVKGAFERGLGHLFTDEEVAAFAVEASPDPSARLQRGAFRLARRLFLYPEESARLPRTPERL